MKIPYWFRSAFLGVAAVAVVVLYGSVGEWLGAAVVGGALGAAFIWTVVRREKLADAGLE